MDLKVLIDLETQGWESLCDGSGATFYGELMTQDAVMSLAGGFLMDRDAVRESLREAPTWDTFRIEEPRVLDAGRDCAVLVYRGVAMRGNEPPFSALMTSVYVRTTDGVSLVSYQQTPITS